jgi:hypothetical protein
MSIKRLSAICFLVMILYLASPSPAYAYLDPGSGSYIFQLLIASLVGLAFLLKVYWGRIRAFFTALFSRGEKVEEKVEENGSA